MISELAKGDFEDLQAAELKPTLEDFDRLNTLALRLECGAETTAANFPRIGWAGDTPIYEPTVAALAWYCNFAARLADGALADRAWPFALANARRAGFFRALVEEGDIRKAVEDWEAGVAATRGELARAARYAACGYDDAEAAAPECRDVARRATKSVAAQNLASLERRLMAAAQSLGVSPSSLEGEPLSRIDHAAAQADVELGREPSEAEARLRAAYNLTLVEIRRRLKAVKEAARGSAE